MGKVIVYEPAFNQQTVNLKMMKEGSMQPSIGIIEALEQQQSMINKD